MAGLGGDPFGVARNALIITWAIAANIAQPFPSIPLNTLTPALLDRLPHHAATGVIECHSYRLRDQDEDSFKEVGVPRRQGP